MTARARPLAVTGLPAAALELRESARATRLTLRVDPGRDVIQVVVPVGVSEAEAARFVGRHAEWVRGRLAAMPPRRPFAEGSVVPVLGTDHVIRHAAGYRGATHRASGEIRVGGEPEFIARRVRDFLMQEARTELARRSRAKAATIGKRVAAVTVRDTRSRWGSCASSGRLSFSWRLILTPEEVFDYVVAHEVAHLREMNHGSRFWALVATLTPEVEAPRAWLKANGASLLRFG
ncbi:M48 family metallopeptidase [Skermanella sp. TT6]|uniref:M48 family metallopeptidase n=1 Tax=Skermanella cutis TaxID=2775420 RepID=A0ABX7B776_9PROT|nr:SprT family zinc-dependent metalloprotease [Skermanella sp. TT6]QQP90219.1 M48 family metallopeptidase [Skermanella sp. TT6]